MEKKPKTKIPTKEELVISVERLGADNARWINEDGYRRHEISVMLGSTRRSERYGNVEETVVVLTWPQIYFELGKLKSQQKSLQYVEDIERMRLDVQELKIQAKEEQAVEFKDRDERYGI